MFLRATTVVKLVALARIEGDHAGALFYLVCYIFLLRARSEAIPIVIGKQDQACEALGDGVGACLSMKGTGCAALRLRRRKNKPHGSFLQHGCWWGCAGATYS